MPIVNDDGVHETELDAVAFTLPPELKRIYITKDVVPPAVDPGDDKMVVSPEALQLGRELDEAEINPTTGTGLEVNWQQMNRPTGEVKLLDVGDSPLKRELDDFKVQASKPYVALKDTPQEDIDTAINVAMGSGPAMIAGVGSATANFRALGSAMSREGFKDSAAKIVKETGWYKGVDDKWRYEISDLGMKLKDRDWTHGQSGKLKDFVEHPELYKAYPEIADYKFEVAPPNYKSIASVNSGTKTIIINPSKIESGDQGLLDVLAHELQHTIQLKEGFALGGGPQQALSQATTALVEKMKVTKDPEAKKEMMELFLRIHDNANDFAHYMYMRLPGEVEANSVAARRLLTDEQRKAFPVKEMEKMLEGSQNKMIGSNYVTDFVYPK